MTQEDSLAADLTRRMTGHGIPPACQDLIIGLLQLRESRRTSISAAVEHPWILQAEASQSQHGTNRRVGQ